MVILLIVMIMMLCSSCLAIGEPLEVVIYHISVNIDHDHNDFFMILIVMILMILMIFCRNPILPRWVGQ